MPTSAGCVSLCSTLGQVRDAELRPPIHLLGSFRVHPAAVLSAETTEQLLFSHVLLVCFAFPSACV